MKFKGKEIKILYVKSSTKKQMGTVASRREQTGLDGNRREQTGAEKNRQEHTGLDRNFKSKKKSIYLVTDSYRQEWTEQT